jgi:large conductance mechanosensitive channel
MWKDFKAFIMRGNVVDLAVAVVIGAAFGAIVKSLVDDVIMPPLGLLTGKVDFSGKYLLLRAGSPTDTLPYSSPTVAKAHGAVTVNYGLFINALLTFLIVAFAVFIVVRIVNRLSAKPAPPTPNTKSCPYCTMSVALAATRCPNCTSQLSAA